MPLYIDLNNFFDVMHCIKSVRIRSYSGPHFSRIGISPYSARMRENAGKMRTRITPNADSF